MKLYAPNYYTKFACIADKCKHNCCIGWEIDIDTDTYEYYKTVEGEFGKRLFRGIDDNNTPHFILTENEQCPFLNNNNLCDIISELGESNLCQICTDHPRFRNFLSSRTEIGLGMCCEEVARIILTNKEKFSLTEIGCDKSPEFLSDEETVFFNLRSKIFSILQDRTHPVNNRVARLMSELNISLPQKSLASWCDLYLSLEHLNSSWVCLLKKCKNFSCIAYASSEFDTAFEQLLVYFIYRHLPGGLYDGLLRERILFAILSCLIINMIFISSKKTIDNLCEIARLYSSEIEYSEENLTSLLNCL